MSRRPPTLIGGQAPTFWTFHPVKLAIIWFFELGFMWLIMRTDMKEALWKEPSEDWPSGFFCAFELITGFRAVDLVIKIGTITVSVLIAIDIFLYLISPRGLCCVRFSAPFYFCSCILKDFTIILVIAALEAAQIRSRRNDRGMGWLMMNSCLLEGYFLAPTVYAWMVWSTETWTRKYRLIP